MRLLIIKNQSWLINKMLSSSLLGICETPFSMPRTLLLLPYLSLFWIWNHSDALLHRVSVLQILEWVFVRFFPCTSLWFRWFCKFTFLMDRGKLRGIKKGVSLARSRMLHVKGSYNKGFDRKDKQDLVYVSLHTMPLITKTLTIECYFIVII